MHFIEPEDRRQISMFPSLDNFVEADNPVRLLDLIVEEVVQANPDQFLRRGLSNVGRRAYSPQILLKLYLYGYLHGISSSRKLEAETKRNMELMWLLGRLSPDHKTIADYRKDHGDAIRFLTLRFRSYLIDESYISGKHVALDGTKIKANAAHGKFMRTKSLERRIQALESQLESYLAQLKRNDVVEQTEEDEDGSGNLNEALIERICELEEELRLVKDDQQQLEESPLKEIHRTDPDCRNMRSARGFEPAYNLQMITDMTFGMIAFAEVRQEPGDQGLTEEMVDNLEEETSIVPQDLFADKAYFSAEQLHWLEADRGITSWIPAPEWGYGKRDKQAGISFKYLPEIDAVQCSEGKLLHRKGINRPKQIVHYLGRECQKCSIKSKCTSANNRYIQLPFLQPWIDVFRKRMNGQQGKLAMKKRKAWIEHPFGTIKSWMGKIPLKVRGKPKVQAEIDLYTTAYNFKRLIATTKHLPIEEQVKDYNWMGP